MYENTPSLFYLDPRLLEINKFGDPPFIRHVTFLRKDTNTPVDFYSGLVSAGGGRRVPIRCATGIEQKSIA